MGHPPRRSLIALDSANAVLADVRDGLGPYLAIYRVAVREPSHGWTEASAGGLMRAFSDRRRRPDARHESVQRAAGAVAMVQGLDAALSARLAGAIVVLGGFGPAFLTLAGVGAAGLVFHALFIPETRPSETADGPLPAPAE